MRNGSLRSGGGIRRRGERAAAMAAREPANRQLGRRSRVLGPETQFGWTAPAAAQESAAQPRPGHSRSGNSRGRRRMQALPALHHASAGSRRKPRLMHCPRRERKGANSAQARMRCRATAECSTGWRFAETTPHSAVSAPARAMRAARTQSPGFYRDPGRGSISKLRGARLPGRPPFHIARPIAAQTPTPDAASSIVSSRCLKDTPSRPEYPPKLPSDRNTR